MDDFTNWLTQVLARKPSDRAEVDRHIVKLSVLNRKASNIEIMGWESDTLFDDVQDAFSCGAFKYRPPRDVFFMITKDRAVYIIDCEGYDYARYIGRVI